MARYLEQAEQKADLGPSAGSWLAPRAALRTNSMVFDLEGLEVCGPLPYCTFALVVLWALLKAVGGLMSLTSETPLSLVCYFALCF